jgi:hypothetical protein
MTLRSLGAAGLATVALLALPATGSASPLAGRECHRQAKSTTYSLSLQGSHGYRINIESFPSGKVVLIAEKANFLAQYAVDGRSDERGLEAQFGRLGRIAVHPRPVRHAGDFLELEGTIEFHGEEGFTSISLTHARGFVFHPLRRTCSDAHSRVPLMAAARSDAFAHHSREVRMTVVVGESTPNRAVVMRIESSQPPSREEGGADFAVAFLEERREGMYIARATILDPQAGTVTASPPGTEPLSGNIALPSPFSGAAAFSRASGSATSWSGDLTVSLPGASNVPLTGPGFSSVACNGMETHRLQACEEEAHELAVASFLRPSLYV